MNRLMLIVLLLCLVGCAHAPPYRNDRPMRPMPPARELIPQCEVTVQFNEDEASVPESKYLDSMFCLGMMEALLSTNSYLSSYTQPLFCPPPPGIKTWIAAKAVVEYADQRPELLDLEEAHFAIQALAAKYPCHER